MDIAKKKRQTEEEVDFKKGIISQRETSEPLAQNPSIDAYYNISFYLVSRAKYGENEFVGASKRLEGLSEDNLRQSSATFHATCRKTTVSFKKLKR